MEVTALDTQDAAEPASAISTPTENHPLSGELLGLRLSHTKQKGDCLYLYSQEPQADCASNILEAIAISTQDLEGSVLFSEGIRRLKLHGKAWALGVDLPITQSAIAAAEVIAALLNTFRKDPKLVKTKLKLLLQNHCLNLLCETATPILQAELALPMLNTLRSVQAAEYFQAVTVSNRVIGDKKPNWSFEIDLLAIGAPDPEVDQQQVNLDPDQEIAPLKDLDQDLEQDFGQTSDRPWLRSFSNSLLEVGKFVFGLRWLGQTNPQIASVPICIASLAIGIGATVAIDRQLSNYAQSNTTKLIISNSQIDTQDSNPDKGISAKPVPNFNISLFNEKLSLLDWQATDQRRSPDILIMGSSRALRGIEPSALEQALAAKGYPNLKAFNLGIDGATAQVVNIQLTEILTRPQLPKMIIWADGLRAFNSSRNDITYEEITASVGYQQLQKALKDGNPNQDNPIANGNENAKINQPIAQALNLVFATPTKRQEVRTSVVKSFDKATHALSNSEALIAATMPNTVTAIDSKGFVAFDITFDPITYFQKYPQVSGDYDLDYRNFEPVGIQFESLTNVADFCRRNNIQLVVINMPLHGTYLDGIRMRYENTFNRRMEELALRESFTYLNFSQSLQNQAPLFSDPSHLNRQGAIALSKLLAQNPKIAWRSLKQ